MISAHGVDGVEASDRELLDRALRGQRAMTYVFRGLALFALVAVELGGIFGTPHPALAGSGLAVTLALIAFAVGSLGAVAGAPIRSSRVTALLALLATSAGALYWLQPNGPAILGSFVGAGAAALRLPRRSSGFVAGMALVALAAPLAFATGHSPGDVLLISTGVLGFYAMGELAQRLRTGQELASRLLAELEASQAERAEAAALAERERVAREIHDVLAHSLSGLVLQLEAARLLARREGTDPAIASAVDRSLHLAKSGLAEARGAIGVLRDAELPGPEALEPLAADFARDTGIACAFELSGAPRPLSPATRLALYRVAQEALTNVRRHARPEHVEVRLAYGDGGACLTVEDIGAEDRELSPVAPGSDGAGYGITGMRERAELLGGHLDACPTATGFRVELWVPA